MHQTHEVVIPFHRNPMLGKGMFIEIALMFIDQKDAFDSLAIAGPKVTAGIHVQAVERTT